MQAEQQEKFISFNPVAFMETHEEIEDYLRDAFQDENPQVFIASLSFLIRHHGVADVAEKAA